MQNEPAVDADHFRPDGVDDELVQANGTFSEALERLERARGHLDAFHQLTGRADMMLDDVADGLRATGHGGLADRVEATSHPAAARPRGHLAAARPRGHPADAPR